MGRQVDFKALAEAIDITDAAARLGLRLKPSGKDLRTRCPACETDDERSLAIIPETNSFRCHAAQKSGDCVSLWAHVRGIGNYKAALELEELFADASAPRQVSPTSPQKPSGLPSSPEASTAAAASKSAQPFDPNAYAAKLVYNADVAALGLSQDDARELGIGYSSAGLHKGIAFALRWPDGTIAGFASVVGGQVKLPKRLIPQKIVQLRRA